MFRSVCRSTVVESQHLARCNKLIIRSCSITPAVGYVLPEKNDAQILMSCKIHLQKLKGIANTFTEEHKVIHSYHRMQFLRDLCALIEQNVPCEQILRTRVRPIGIMKHQLKSFSKVDGVSEMLGKKFRWALRSACQDCYKEILYAGIFVGPYQNVNRTTANIVLVVEHFPDSHGINFQQFHLPFPDLGKNYFRVTDINQLKFSLCNSGWNDIKQIFMQDHFQLLTTPVWDELHSCTISQLHFSRALLNDASNEIHSLTQLNDIDRSLGRCFQFENVNLICLQFILKWLHHASPPGHAKLAEDIESLTRVLDEPSRKWINQESEIKMKLLQFCDNLDKAILQQQSTQSAAHPVDVQLSEWAEATNFRNNFTKDDVIPCKSKITLSPDCNIADELSLYEDQEMSSNDRSRVQGLLEYFGDPVNKIQPENVLLISKYGSHLYNLSTSESDIDYMIVFRRSAKFSLPNFDFEEKLQKFDDVSKLEYEAIEVRLFCQRLFNTSPLYCELVFADERADYVHPLFRLLMKNWKVLISERLYNGYVGYAEKYLRYIRLGVQEYIVYKHFYKVIHKIIGIEDIVNSRKPRVTLKNEDRSRLLKVRNGEAFKNLSTEKVYQELVEKLKKIDERRDFITPEYPDYKSLRSWLALVRNTSC